MTWIGSDLEENLYLLLREKKFDSVLETLKNPKYDNFVLENVWNIINLICLTVKTESLLKSDTDISSCKRVLMLLVNKGNPKEVLVSLLEQADSFKDNEFFCMLLGPLQCTLGRTPGKRAKTLQWVLSALNAHIETLSLPQDLDLEGDERLLLDADPAVQDADYVLSYYMSFIDYFVNEVSFENLKKGDMYYFQRIYNQQELLHRYILKLFYHPFLYHDLHVASDSRPKSNIQSLCESYMKCMAKICRNVFNLFKYGSECKKEKKSLIKKCDDDEEESENDEDNVPMLALSNLSYLIFVENLALDFQPFVHSNVFIFMKNLRYIILLLQSSRNLVLFKGLCLADVLLNKLDDSQLNYDCIELDIFTEFPKHLLNIATTCKFEAHRKSAINNFLSYMSKCNHKGRYHLILQVLSTANHSGAEGLVINLYKNYLHEALNNKESGEYFLGKNFNLFMKKVFVLKDGIETDVIENSDKIVTALNLLRYLLLRDSKGINITGIWDLISFISEHFLTPLTTGLDLSRAHYKQAMKDAGNDSRKKGSVNTTVSVNNEILPNVPLHLQKDLYNKALMTFDVIESILCRVKELMLD